METKSLTEHQPSELENRIAQLERQVSAMRKLQAVILFMVAAVAILVYAPGWGFVIALLLCVLAGAGLVGFILKKLFPRLNGM